VRIPSAGVLTSAGGRTSHAAVVARELGKVYLVGCPGLRVDVERRRCFIGDRELAEGETLYLDGNSGAVFADEVRLSVEAPTAELVEIARWRAQRAPEAPRSGRSVTGVLR
jgi:pyruvate, orthophosphate dikinase